MPEEKSEYQISDSLLSEIELANSILNNTKDINPEYSALVDEKFWDLVFDQHISSSPSAAQLEPSTKPLPLSQP